MKTPAPLSRREFVKTAAAAAAATSMFSIARAQTAGGAAVKVALIGCGGRGNKDLSNFIEACALLGLTAKVVALADAFPDRVAASAQKHAVPSRRAFAGFDSYRRIMETDAGYVILATPPVFRPTHLAALIEAGKHVMMEKPVAVDAPGCRRVIELGEAAAKKGLGILAGTQRRHDISYLRNKAAIDAGAIGPILSGVVSWNGKVPWIWEREPDWSDADYMARNWLNFSSMSGDHICEQHVHNLDVANWFLGRTPVSAVGFGGRAQRETGDQYDFFSVDLDYGDGVRVHSQCRQISGAYARTGEFFRGAEGELFGGGKMKGRDVTLPDIAVLSEDGSVQEMVDLITSVRADQPLNEARAVAEASATAIMGRISAYTGKMVRWTDLMTNTQSEFYNLALPPGSEAFEGGQVVAPPENVVPVPGDGTPIRRRKPLATSASS
ncbi:MAG: Gfo/Idh/MocA family protein [Opitutaceae bacterium]